MPRPSRNLDRALLAAGRELLPARGFAALSVREVAERAGVNLGMFHYHFGTRERFLRAVLQQVYEEMFERLTLEAGRNVPALEAFALALGVLGRFLRDHRALLTRVLADALTGEPCATEFVRDNLPRHLAVLRRLYGRARRAGTVRAVPFVQALGVCGGALALPIFVGGAIVASGELAARAAAALDRTLLSDAALDERIALALRALAPEARHGHARRAPRRNE